MKFDIFSLIIMIVVLVNYSYQKESSTDSTLDEKNPYIGTKVKTTKTYSVLHKYGKEVDSLIGIVIDNYNERGYKIESLIFDNNNSLIEKIVIRRNLHGDIIECLSYDISGSLIEKETDSYDSSWNLIESVYFFPKEPSNPCKTIYEVDSLSNQKLMYIYYSDGSMFSKTVDKLDSLGNVLESILYDSDNLIISREVNKYNLNSHIIETLFYGPNDNIETKFNIKYDSKGNNVESISTSRSLKWDEDKNILDYEYISIKCVNFYDTRNRPIGTKEYSIKKIFDKEEEVLIKKELSEYEDY